MLSTASGEVPKRAATTTGRSSSSRRYPSRSAKPRVTARPAAPYSRETVMIMTTCFRGWTGRSGSKRNAMPIIETRDLRKVFRSVKRTPGAARRAASTLFSREYVDKVAVTGVTMSLDAGELVGYIGPNGAGKSTTIKMLTGILVPTSGEVRVAGIVPYAEAQRERAQHRRRVRTALAALLGSSADRVVRAAARDLRRPAPSATGRIWTTSPSCSRWASFSARRCASSRSASACAATLRPRCCTTRKVVFLDEPTIGLDVVAKEAIRNFIADVNRERGTTFILTTHDLADVERLCRRIVLIDAAR